MSASHVMITGADGYLGLLLVGKFLENTDVPLLLWVRARSSSELEAKRQAVLWRLPGQANRLSFAYGELTDEVPFAQVNSDQIETIIHCAAVTRFNVDAQTASRVNTEGTRKLLKFAAGLKSLKRLALLSTIYASGLKPGPIMEEPMSGEDGFANYYEQSKWASEHILMTEFADLPWLVCRIATVIADNADGRVVQQNAFHNTLKLFYYGLLSLAPGKPDTPLYFVCGDFVARAVFSALTRGPLKRVYHVCHTREQSPKLNDLIELAFDTFAEDDSFTRRRVLRPLYADLEAFTILTSGVSGLRDGIMSQAVGSVSPFAPQLYVDKDVRNENIATLTSNLAAPPADLFLRNTCRYLVRTRWGKEVTAGASIK